MVAKRHWEQDLAHIVGCPHPGWIFAWNSFLGKAMNSSTAGSSQLIAPRARELPIKGKKDALNCVLLQALKSNSAPHFPPSGSGTGIVHHKGEHYSLRDTIKPEVR